MATIAEQIAARAGKSIEQTTPDIPKAVEQGAKIAQAFEQQNLAKQKLEVQKKQLFEQKIGRFSDSLLKAEKIKDPRSRKLFLNKFIPRQRDALGLGDVFTDDQLNFIGSSDENFLKFKSLISQTQRGELNFQQALSIAADPELFAEFELGPAEAEELLGAERGALAREFQKEKFELQQKGIAKRTAETREFQLAQTQRKAKAKLSGDLAKAGIPGLETTISKIDEQLAKYKGKNLPGIGGPEALVPTGRLSPEGKRMRQLALGLANQFIKSRTGATMNEQEANRIMGEIGIDLAVGEGGGISAIFKGTKSDKDFIRGVGDVKDALKATIGELERGSGVKRAPAPKPAAERKELKKFAAPRIPAKLSSKVFLGFDAEKQGRLAERLGLSVDEIKAELKKAGR